MTPSASIERTLGRENVTCERPVVVPTLHEPGMIGYIALGTNDLPRAKSFYDALLCEMGITRLMDFGDRGHGWAASLDQPMLRVVKPYDGQPATAGNGVMAGLAAGSRETVDRVHGKALEFGGADEGKPGLRAEVGEGLYAACFLDLDGNNLDVFCCS